VLPSSLGRLQLARWGRWSHTDAGQVVHMVLARRVDTGSVDRRLAAETVAQELRLDIVVDRIGLAVVDMGRYKERALELGRVGIRLAKVDRRAVGCTGFAHRSPVAVVAGRTDIPAAGNFDRNFVEAVRSLVLAPASRTG